jgi:hypothetical protein
MAKDSRQSVDDVRTLIGGEARVHAITTARSIYRGGVTLFKRSPSITFSLHHRQLPKGRCIVSASYYFLHHRYLPHLIDQPSLSLIPIPSGHFPRFFRCCSFFLFSPVCSLNDNERLTDRRRWEEGWVNGWCDKTGKFPERILEFRVWVPSLLIAADQRGEGKRRGGVETWDVTRVVSKRHVTCWVN